MDKKISVDEYFTYPESNRPMELVYGYVREPAMPAWGHESVLLRLAELLRAHVRERNLGEVCRADVVLDREGGLVLQPDLMFIAAARMGIVDDRVWGPPDLAIEIASPSTAHRDKTLKLEWYRRYGVKEYWLVSPRDQVIEVVDLPSGTRQPFAGEALVQSRVLAELTMRAEECFA